MKRWFQAASALVVFGAAACGEAPTAARSATPLRADLTPLSAYISGPTKVVAGHTCTWGAYVSGGTPPYIYHWDFNSNALASNPASPANLTTSLSTFGTIGLEVLDQAGGDVYVTFNVTTGQTGAQC